MIYNNGLNNHMAENRPYEKCLTSGPSVLSDAELLAVIIRTGTKGKTSVQLAEDILDLSNVHKGLTGISQLSFQDLVQLPGIGEVKAIQIMCVAELSKRIATYHAKNKISFSNPESIAAYYMEQLRHEEKEMIICMFLDSKNHLLGESLISIGTVNSSSLSPREIYLTALNYHAVNIILVHNHPSGDPHPSQSDIEITHKIKYAGDILDVHLIDHIIIGDHQYVSLREMSELF